MPPRKREAGEITDISVPSFTDAQKSAYFEGLRRFNRGQYWHAHEAWEAAWLPMGDDAADDAEIFLRALIQLASGLHLKRIGRYNGAQNHFRKAAEKFRVIPTRFMGLDVASLRVFTDFQARHFPEDYVCRMRYREEDW
ncbi:MAG: DUF309 domain-containing protein [Bacteroidetes bacterium]|nr:DUF309 domain-containing protein [Bacteroidota bacterium]